MPSRRHNAAIDSSPRRPSSTMRIFSSAPYCLRVARRMSFATCSAEAFCVRAFCLIFAPLKGYDEPEILPSQLSRFCLIGADAGHYELEYFARRHGITKQQVLEMIKEHGSTLRRRSLRTKPKVYRSGLF